MWSDDSSSCATSPGCCLAGVPPPPPPRPDPDPGTAGVGGACRHHLAWVELVALAETLPQLQSPARKMRLDSTCC